MIRLSTFGSVDVRDDSGNALDPVLAQPKRVALLVYLAAARPVGFHRRDRLLALFWPGLDETRARDALNQSLRFLRQALGPDAFLRRGSDEVGLDPDRVWCDAVAFRRALEAGQPNDALALYRGDFLTGFFADEADGFEEWLERERAALRDDAARGARQLAARHEAEGTFPEAIEWGKRSLELTPDEAELRRVLGMFDRVGNRAGALHVYDEFARRMAAEYDWTPSPETVRAVDRLRTITLPQRAHEAIAERSYPIAGAAAGDGAAAVQPNRDEIFEQRASEPVMIRRAVALYAAAFVFVAGLAWVAMVGIGLPDWVLPGTLIVMGAGLPVVLLTAVARYAAHRSRLGPSVRSRDRAAALASWAVRLDQHLSWRRVALGGMAALGVFVAAVVGYMTSRVTGVGPAATLLSAGSLQGRPRLLIMDFAVKGADSSLAGPASDAVRIGLGQSRTVRLVDPADVQEVLRRMQRPPDTRVDVDVARAIAAREGVSAIVDGEVTGYPGGYIVTLRLLHAANGTVLAGPFQVARSDFIDAVDAVARQLRGKIGEPLKTVRASQPLSRLTTSSLEALQLYSEAHRTTQGQTRIQILRRAVAIDSNFATAWRTMAIAMGNVSYPQASIDSALTRAYQLRDRLGDRERYFAEAIYFGMGPVPDRRRSVDGWRGVIRIDDSASGAWNNLGMEYKSRRDWVRAESAFRAALNVAVRASDEPDRDRRPPFAPLNNIVVPLLAQGKVAAVESVTAIHRKAYPNDYGALMSALRVRYARGEVAEYDRAVDSVRASGGGGRGPVTTRANAIVAQLRGRLGRSEGLWAEVAGWNSRMRVRHHPLTDSIRLAHFDVWYRVRRDRAVTRLDAALRAHPLGELAAIERPHAAIATVYAQAGRPDKARAVLAQLTGSGDTVLMGRKHPQIHNALAEIALAENRTRDAVAEFRRADSLPDGPVDENPLRVLANVGRAFDRANEPDSAIAYFEQYLETPYFFRIGGKPSSNPEIYDAYDPPDAFFRADIYRRLGELLERKEERDRAGTYYAKFIELWQNADPDLQPRVAEARSRLMRLNPAVASSATVARTTVARRPR